MTGHPEKGRVAASFSRAAASYDSVATLQRQVSEHLLALLPMSTRVRLWLDLGCGTGYCSRALLRRFPEAQGLSVDIAEGMLHYLREHNPDLQLVAGDAEQLPLRDQCCDLIFSSLAVQWCADFSAVLRQARRVLRPGGVLAFSSLCTGTLQELRDSWQEVDGFVHVNRFRRVEDYQAQCQAAGLRLDRLHQRCERLYYPDLQHLTHALKTLGAHNLNQGRPLGLAGRSRLRALADAYEMRRQPEGLPCTYQVIYGVLYKEGKG
jgi:malonyl-CoA O-methyltransferase